MNRPDAKKIAQTITTDQLYIMILTARRDITDWSEVSICNKGISKGTAWNILCSNFDPNEPNHSNLYKINLIREFGKFLPEELKPEKKIKKPVGNIVHQDPIFTKFE